MNAYGKWSLVPLSELAKPVKRSILVEPGTSFRTIGVKLWGNGAYERQTIDGSQTAATTLNEVREDDLIINKIWVRNGSVAIVPSEVSGCCGSNEFPTFILNLDKVLPRWMHWYTKTKDLWGKCDALSQGSSGKNRIRPERFLTVTIPLPPLEEQRRIVVRIDSLVSKLEEVKLTRQLQVEEANAMLRSRFSQITSDAPRKKMALVAPLVRRPAKLEVKGRYPELGIRSYGKGTFHKPALDYLEVGSKKLYSIEPGDLVFSNVFAWEGAIAVAQPEDSGRFGSHRFITCVPDKGFATADFLCFYFLTTEGLDRIGAASPGGAGRNRTLGLNKLAEIDVPVPPYESQIKFDRLIHKVREMRQTLERTDAEINALVPSILDRAFQGGL